MLQLSCNSQFLLLLGNKQKQKLVYGVYKSVFKYGFHFINSFKVFFVNFGRKTTSNLRHFA